MTFTSLDYFAGLNAASTDPHMAGALRGLHPDILEVGQEAAFGEIVGVADAVTHPRPLAADFADSRHKNLGLSKNIV